jgi:hypothetical protein
MENQNAHVGGEWVSSNSSTLIAAGQSFLWLSELWSCGWFYCFYQNWVMDSWVVDDVCMYRSFYPLLLLLQEVISLLLVKPAALKDSKMHVVSCNEPKKLLLVFVCVQGKKFNLSCKFFSSPKNSTTNQKTQFTLNWDQCNTNSFITNLCFTHFNTFCF